MQAEITQTLDVSGKSCPIPILKTKKTIKGLAIGELLKVISTDPGSKQDMVSWAKMTGHQIVDSFEKDGKFIFIIKKIK